MEYLDEDGVSRLLGTLMKRTQTGESRWSDAGHEFEFKTSGKKYMYFIASGDKDDLAPYIFQIWRGDPTDDSSPTQHESELLQDVQTSEFSKNNDALRDLYKAAKRVGLNTEEIAAEILADFD